jgi:hypothetical protein
MSAHQQVEPGHTTNWSGKSRLVEPVRTGPKFTLATIFAPSTEERSIVNSRFFHRFLLTEKKRAERSKTSFMLVVLNVKGVVSNPTERKSLSCIEQGIFSSIRNTDFVGWYEENQTCLGIVFTEIAEPNQVIACTIIDRVRTAITPYVSSEVLQSINYTCQIYQPKLHGTPAVERRRIACD